MIGTGGDLLALLQEAMPDTQTPTLVAARDGIQGTLMSGGFLRLAPDGPGDATRA
jgi:hypothetical protein